MGDTRLPRLSGRHPFTIRAQDITSHGDIVCFTIVGGQAWIGGVTERATDVAIPGTESIWRVVDRGQGSGALPDLISLLQPNLPTSSATNYCNAIPAFPDLNPVRSGNIHVDP